MEHSFSRPFFFKTICSYGGKLSFPGPFVHRKKSFETSFFSAVPGLAVPTKSS